MIKIPEGDPTQHITKLDRLSPNHHQESWSCSSVGGPNDCNYYLARGYFQGKYISAFEEFLRLTEFAWPARIDDPIISLFLLICDLAINPTRGLPFPIVSFKDFIIDLDPGARFTRLCNVAREAPLLANAIKSRSLEEYVEVAAALTEPCGYDHPMAALETIIQIIEKDSGGANLMLEWEKFEFTLPNQPIRILVSQFLAFCRDKYQHPEFFCWPGAYVAGPIQIDEHREMFVRNLSLFSDRSDNDGIFPRGFPGKSNEILRAMLTNFYGSIVIYDLARQWMLEDGPFRYDFHWLTGKHDNASLIEWAKANFRGLFGANPDTVEHVKSSAPSAQSTS